MLQEKLSDSYMDDINKKHITICQRLL